MGTFSNNPYWVVNENPFENEVDRVFGSASVDYSPLDWMTVTGRFGLDSYTEDRRAISAIGTVGRDDGAFSLDVIQERQLNYDLMTEMGTDLNEDFNLRTVLGVNWNWREREIQRNVASGLMVAGLYNFANANSSTPTNSYWERKLYGVFADATLGYRDYLFLNVTGRNDWSSTLPEANNSFFYPSVNVSFIPTDAFNIAGDVLSYMKVRANCGAGRQRRGSVSAGLPVLPVLEHLRAVRHAQRLPVRWADRLRGDEHDSAEQSEAAEPDVVRGRHGGAALQRPRRAST